MRSLLAAGACGLVLINGCGASAEQPRQITVFAAASLTDVFKFTADIFEKDHPGFTVRFNFAGTPTLVTQIEQGAQADVFASADTANMERLKTDGWTLGEPRVFAHNKLEIVVAPNNPKEIRDLADLARPGIIYVSAGPTVPAGKYAAQALDKAGVKVRPRSLETDVKSVVSKVRLGEADAGIVYATDVKAAGDSVTGVDIPDRYNVIASYPVVAVKGTAQIEVANGFIAWLLSTDGILALLRYGFQPA
jgi:molybdate transport system substrate-binding protein